MTQPAPTPQALERLRTLGDRRLLSFFNEVTTKTNRALLNVLPSVDGFRKDSVASLPKRKQALLHQLFKKGGAKASKARAEDAYYYLWRAWAQQHLAQVEGLATLLDGIERATTKEHPQVAADQPQAEIETLFRSLHEQSFLNHCDAETIARLLQFSPFETTDTLQLLASSAKPLVAVQKDRELSVLPGRIQEHEDRLRGLQSEIKGLSGDVARLAETVASIVSRPAPVADDSALANALENIHDELSALRKGMEAHGQHATRVSAETDARLKRAEHSVTDLEALWSDLDDRTGKQAAELHHQLADIVQRVAQLGQATSPVRPQADIAVVPATPSLRMVPLTEQTGSVKALGTALEAAGMLTSNYAALGLRSSGAATFAEEVLTAIVACKVLFFKGSFATELARVTAMTLAAKHVVRAQVPVGFVDATTMDADVAEALGDRNGAVGALVLERVNNVPFELLVDATADLVRHGNVVVLASLADGITTFPEQVLCLQLGPVFDTDVLDWSLFPKKAALARGSLTSLDASALSTKPTNGDAQSEELVRMLRIGPSFRNPHIERTAVAFMNALERFRTADAPSSLQSAAYGWLWPLWKMTCLAPEDIEEQLDGGRVDSENYVDTRLQLLMGLAGIKAK